VVLQSGALLTVAGDAFNDNGKGGAVSIEAGSETNGSFDGTAVVDIETGSTIDLSVVGNNNPSVNAALGEYNGTLHLRAPQNSTATGLQVNPINGTVLNPSSIVVEGYKIFTPVAGVVDTVESAVSANGQAFAANTAAIRTGLTANWGTGVGKVNPTLDTGLVHVEPGAEVINATPASTPTSITLNSAGSSSISVLAGNSILFPSGTPGNDKIKVSSAGTITDINGVVTSFAANSTLAIAAGSTVTFTQAGSLTFAAGGTGGAISIALSRGSYTAGGAASITTGNGTGVTLNAAGSSFAFIFCRQFLCAAQWRSRQ